MKIFLITSKSQTSDDVKPDLENLGELVIIIGKKMKTQEIIYQAKSAEIIIAGPGGVERISKDMLEGLPNLKMIATLTVGVDWVDLDAAKMLKITVCNTKGANAESVAEHAWGMILDLSKRISEFDRDVRNKGAYKYADYIGKEVYGKTIGIIGLGDIGIKIARIANAFNMNILGVSKNKKAIDGVIQVEKEFLLKNSDIIVVVTPLTKETEGIIAQKDISLMKHGVILINPAREALTDKKAIIDGIKSGKIFGFGIETDIMKPVSAIYLNHPRILVTPHNAFNTEEANRKTYELAIANVKAYIEGKPQNIVS